jgi:hypothetical protein
MRYQEVAMVIQGKDTKDLSFDLVNTRQDVPVMDTAFCFPISSAWHRKGTQCEWGSGCRLTLNYSEPVSPHLYSKDGDNTYFMGTL